MKLIKKEQNYKEVLKLLQEKVLPNNSKKIVIDINREAIKDVEDRLKKRYPNKIYSEEELIEKLLNQLNREWKQIQNEELDLWLVQRKEYTSKTHYVAQGIINTKNINKFKKYYRYGGIEMMRTDITLEQLVYTITEKNNPIYQSKRYNEQLKKK